MELHLPENAYKVTLALAAITCDPALHVRIMTPSSQQQAVEHYRKLYADSKDLGPLTVVEEVDDAGMATGTMLLADGYFRYQALVRMGRTEAACTVFRGDAFTATLIATRENGSRGMPVDQPDRKQIARQLLIEVAQQDAPWSIQAIADLADLDRATVRGLRHDLMHRRGLTIPDAIDEHLSDGQDDTLPPIERRRYDSAGGYVSDPLLDMPGADSPPPPAPKRQGHAKRGSGKRPK